eukprot:jgi/Botrbrau1/8636/Bobra.0196s0030.1
MNPEAGLPGRLGGQYGAEDPRHPRPSDPRLVELQFNPTGEHEGAQDSHRWRRARHKPPVIPRDSSATEAPMVAAERVKHSTRTSQLGGSHQTPNGIKPQELNHSPYISSPMDFSPYAPPTMPPLSSERRSSVGLQGAESRGAPEHVKLEPSSVRGSHANYRDGERHSRQTAAQNSTGPFEPMAEARRDSWGGAPYRDWQHDEHELSEHSGSGSDSELSCDSLAFAFETSLHAHDGVDKEVTHDMARLLSQNLHIDGHVAPDASDASKASMQWHRSSVPVSPGVLQSSRPADQSGYSSRVSASTRRTANEAQFNRPGKQPTPVEHSPLRSSQIDSDNSLGLTDDSLSSPGSNFSSSEDGEVKDLAREFASKVFLAGGRKASLSDAEVLAAMRRLWRMKDAESTEQQQHPSQGGSAAPQSVRHHHDGSRGGLHHQDTIPPQGTFQSSCAGVPNGIPGRAGDDEAVENAEAGVGPFPTAAESGVKQDQGGSYQATDAAFMEDLRKKLRVNDVAVKKMQPHACLVPSGQVPEEEDYSAGRAQPSLAHKPNPPDQGDSWSLRSSGGALRQAAPPFVFSSNAEGELAHRSPKHRIRSAFRTMLFRSASAATAESNAFGPAPVMHQQPNQQQQHSEVPAQQASPVPAPFFAQGAPQGQPPPVSTAGWAQPQYMAPAPAPTRPSHAEMEGREAPPARPVERAAFSQKSGWQAHHMSAAPSMSKVPLGPSMLGSQPSARAQPSSSGTTSPSVGQRPTGGWKSAEHLGVSGQQAQPAPSATLARHHLGKRDQHGRSAPSGTSVSGDQGKAGSEKKTPATTPTCPPYVGMSTHQSAVRVPGTFQYPGIPGVHSIPAPMSAEGSEPPIGADFSSQGCHERMTRSVQEPTAAFSGAVGEGHGSPTMYASRMKSRHTTPRKPGLKTKGVSKVILSRSPAASDSGAAATAAALRAAAGSKGVEAFPSQASVVRHPFSQLANPPGANQPFQGSFHGSGVQPIPPRQPYGLSSGPHETTMGSAGKFVGVSALHSDGKEAFAAPPQMRPNGNHGIPPIAVPRHSPSQPPDKPESAGRQPTMGISTPRVANQGPEAAPPVFGTGVQSIPMQGVEVPQNMSGYDSAAVPPSSCNGMHSNNGKASSPQRPGHSSSGIWTDGQDCLQTSSGDKVQTKTALPGHTAKPSQAPLYFSFGGQACLYAATASDPAGQPAGSTTLMGGQHQAAAEQGARASDSQASGPFRFTFQQVPLPEASPHAPLRQYARRASGGRHGARRTYPSQSFPGMESLGAALPRYDGNASTAPPSADVAKPHVPEQQRSRSNPSAHGLSQGHTASQSELLQRSASSSLPSLESHQPSANVRAEELRQRSTTLPYVASRAQLAAQEAEHARRLGNDAFSKAQYSKSAELYTKALGVLQAGGVVEGQGKLQSNLAAAFLQLSRPLSALNACKLAMQAEPNFIRARIRAVTCHMRVGDLAGAAEILSSLEAGVHDPGAKLEVQNKRSELTQLQGVVQQAQEYAAKARTEEAASTAIQSIEEALSHNNAPYSQSLLALKASLLLAMGQHAAAAIFASRHQNPLEPGMAHPVWPHWVVVQSHYFAANLPAAAEALDALLKRAGTADLTLETGEVLGNAKGLELAADIRTMHDLKESGNRSLKAGSTQRAIEQYSAAVDSCSLAGPPAFVAVLHANRAAALQKLKNYTEAIADCLCALALNPEYFKAYSRVAVLLSEVGHHDVGVRVLEGFLTSAPQSPDVFEGKAAAGRNAGTPSPCCHT